MMTSVFSQRSTMIQHGERADALLTLLTCQKCSVPLRQSDCLGIIRHGPTGWVVIPCMNLACENENKVPLGKMHRAEGSRGPKVFDINSKILLGKSFIVQS